MPLAQKYGIIADIHSNYIGLKLALDYLRAARVDKILCLGDIVGKTTDATECVQAIRRTVNIYTIAGEEDRQIVQAIEKPKKLPAPTLSESDTRFLKRLPAGMTIDDTFMMVHGSLVAQDGSILNSQEIKKT